MGGEPKDVETITLALRTLGNFDFTGHSLNEFVRECVVSFLEDDHADVRKAAAETCCKVCFLFLFLFLFALLFIFLFFLSITTQKLSPISALGQATILHSIQCLHSSNHWRSFRKIVDGWNC